MSKQCLPVVLIILLGVAEEAAAKMFGVLAEVKALLEPELPTVLTVRPERGFLACTTTLLQEGGKESVHSLLLSAPWI